MPPRDAEELLARARSELAPLEAAITGHRLLDAPDTLPDSTLRAFAGEQYAILRSDRRSFAHLAGRFPEGPAGRLFLDLATGEALALERLFDLARSLELDEDGLREYEPQPQTQAYPAYVAWLALNGSRADVALAFLGNLEAWGANCGRLAEGLRGRVDVSFFEFFAETPPGFEADALAVVAQGLEAGESPEQALRAARRLQAYELLFWDAIAALG